MENIHLQMFCGLSVCLLEGMYLYVWIFLLTVFYHCYIYIGVSSLYWNYYCLSDPCRSLLTTIPWRLKSTSHKLIVNLKELLVTFQA